MKKIGFILIFSILILSTFAEKTVYDPAGISSNDDRNFIFHDGKDFFVKNQLNNNYAKIPDEYISTEDGHILITYPYNAIGKLKLHTVLLIPGEYYSVEMIYPGKSTKRSNKYYEVVSGKSKGFSSYPFDKNVKSSATSFYKETIRGYDIEYSPDNLFKFIQYLDHVEFVNPDSLPWVEGKEDYGIGESITFEMEVYEGRKYKDTCITAIFIDRRWWRAKENARTYYKNYKSGTLVDFNDLNKESYIDQNDPIDGR